MSTDVFERTSPHSLETERSLLGAILLHPEVLGDAVGVVEPKDFFRDAHQRIFAAMLALDAHRVAIDLTTLKDELGAEQLAKVGGPGYVTALVDGMPRASNVDDYARIVKEKAQLRKLIVTAGRMIDDAYAGHHDAADILERAEQAILGLADTSIEEGFEANASIAGRVAEILDRYREAKGSVHGVPSGFTDLDVMTRGFQPGTLIVLGARPGVGKSSFATNVATRAAALGNVVGMFSLEMPKEELFIRQVAAEASIDSHRLQSGYLSDREWEKVSRIVSELAERPLHIDETPAIKMLTVRSRARRLKVQHGLSLLIIDYLQLMGTSERAENLNIAIGEITGALKSLAKELKLPIILLSQLNRDSVKGDRPRRPQLSDLRAGGSIEQDADIVMFLHRDETDRTVTELIIQKHRNGAEGVVKLRWHEEFTRYDNCINTPDERFLPMGDR